ncbi:hypothetical protein LUZ60_009650 [Juncus effusus]|nr:hypothetical protein LUZ60_009650 [Juncus effusus]
MAGALEEKMIETLTSSHGWRFRDPDSIRSLISSLSPPPSSSQSVRSIESELINMDLRDFGAKSLPDPSSLKKSPHIQGPLILQVVSVRDIHQSAIDATFKSSSKRLLKFTLTDGFTEAIAIEYSPISSINQDIIPGNKVLLENKIPIHDGILCLSSKNFTFIGGIVESLYEEWKMNQKYSGLSRPNTKLSQNDDFAGPPPFEKLQAGSKNQIKMHKSHDSNITKGESSGSHKDLKTENMRADVKKDKLNTSTETEDKNSNTRPKEAIEAVPVQNQAASQKLLQKMQEPVNNYKPRHNRFRNREAEDEKPVFTLDEWEKRNNYANAPDKRNNYVNAPDKRNYYNAPNTSNDEEMARMLQRQMDLEDSSSSQAGNSEADRLRMSMFSFTGEEEGGQDWRGSGNRGRGRGRGRSRGRGRR